MINKTLSVADWEIERILKRVSSYADHDRRRTNYLGRLVTETFSRLLDCSDLCLNRGHLPRLLEAFRVILGEAPHDALSGRCAQIADGYRAANGFIDWEGYYADSQSWAALQTVLVAVARSFRRFEPRREWLLITMAPEGDMAEDLPRFGETQFLCLFQKLFAPMRPETFDESERMAFTERFGSPPDVLFAPVFAHLDEMAARLEITQRQELSHSAFLQPPSCPLKCSD